MNKEKLTQENIDHLASLLDPEKIAHGDENSDFFKSCQELIAMGIEKDDLFAAVRTIIEGSSEIFSQNSLDLLLNIINGHYQEHEQRNRAHTIVEKNLKAMIKITLKDFEEDEILSGLPLDEQIEHVFYGLQNTGLGGEDAESAQQKIEEMLYS